MELSGLNYTAVLYALGWAIAHSLWQMGLLFLVYQLFFGLPKNVKPTFRYGAAVILLSFGFLWFAGTFVEQFNTYQSITRYIEQLPFVESELTVAAETSNSSAIADYLFKTFESFIPFLSAGYLMILILLFVRLINAYSYTQKIRTEGLYPAGVFLDQQLLRLTRKLGLPGNIKIFLTELIDVPATIGFFKPVILLPIATINHLTPEQVEAVILHELAHIRRKDYLINILVSIMETILFFNPFAYLLINTLKKERELFCDDFVVAEQNDPHNYATALLHLEKLRKGSAVLLAVAATGHDGILLSRVKRILKINAPQFQYKEKIIALFFISGLLSMLAWLDPLPVSPKKQIAQEEYKLPLKSKNATTVEELIKSGVEENKSTAYKKPMLLLASKYSDSSKPRTTNDLLATTVSQTFNEFTPSIQFNTWEGLTQPLRWSDIVFNMQYGGKEHEFIADINEPQLLDKFYHNQFGGDTSEMNSFYKKELPVNDQEIRQLLEKVMKLNADQRPIPVELIQKIELLQNPRYTFHYNLKNRRKKETGADNKDFDTGNADWQERVFFRQPAPDPRDRVDVTQPVVTTNGTPAQTIHGQSYIFFENENKNHAIAGNHVNIIKSKPSKKGAVNQSRENFFIGDEMRETVDMPGAFGIAAESDTLRTIKRKTLNARNLRYGVAVTTDVKTSSPVKAYKQAISRTKTANAPGVAIFDQKSTQSEKETRQKIVISIETSNETISIELDNSDDKED